MTRFSIGSLAFLAHLWLPALGTAAAQPLPAEGEYRDDWRCTDALRADLPALEQSDDRDRTACARVGGALVGASVELVHADGDTADGDDVRLHLVTPHGELSIALDDARHRFGAAALGWIDSLEVRLLPVAGAPHLVHVSVVGRSGEDYSSAEETIVLVDVRRAPILRWAGAGAYGQSDYFVCRRERSVTVRVRGGVLHVRSRVSHAIAPDDGRFPEGLHAQLAAPCASPERVTVDYVLTGP